MIMTSQCDDLNQARLSIKTSTLMTKCTYIVYLCVCFGDMTKN